MSDNELYDEDVIVNLRNHMDKLKGMILMDNNDDLFVFKDYEIESITYTTGFFKKRKVTEFYIKWIKLSSGNEEFHHENDRMCSIYGVQNLMEYHLKWSRMQMKLIKFCSDTGITLNFTPMIGT